MITRPLRRGLSALAKVPAGALAGALALGMVSHAATAQELTDAQIRDLTEQHWHCFVTMTYAEAAGNTLVVEPNDAWELYAAGIRVGQFDEDEIRRDVHEELTEDYGYIIEAEVDEQPETFFIYAWRQSEQCADAYKRIRIAKGESVPDRKAAAAAASAGASAGAEGQEITVSFLRDHYRDNRNARVIVDYLIERYPDGKRLMGDPIPELEYLGELIGQLSSQGMQSLSDQALVAIANGQFWQYNPPASRKVDEEYRRRLRVRRYNDRDAQLWAQRMEQQRREEFATAANRSAERWGMPMKCTNVAPRGYEGSAYTTCRPLDRFGQ